MKRIMYLFAIGALVLCQGCGEEPNVPHQSSATPTTAAYKALLEKRKSSVGGANINIRQEVSKFQNASDAEKRDLYNQVNALVN